MIEDYQNIIKSLLEKQSKQEALFALFELIQQKIPLDRLCIYKVDRNAKLVTIFIEYSLDDYVSNISYPVQQFAPIELILLFQQTPKKIVIRSKKDKNERFILADQLPFPVSSYMSFLFQINKDLNSYMLFSCFSEKTDVFTEEHQDFLSIVRPFLEELVLELYIDNPSAQAFLASKIILPTSHEEQLRACPCMQDIVKEIETIAPYDVVTLITGPNGSGKELVATTLHALSTRHNKPFIDVNCAGIPESLLESELFGFEKGAFTGAIQAKRGYFEQADKATIFLDEIGELSEHSQARLLRVLENRKIQRIGSERSISLDVKIIAATNQNLLKLVEQGKFREDLYYRLKGFHIEIPPLNARKQDIKYLAEYFYSSSIERNQLKNPPVISLKTIRQLMDYAWPGNVRQLKHTIEEGIFKAISKGKSEIEFDFLKTPRVHASQKALQVDEIKNALEKANGKIEGNNGAASILGVNPSTLRSRMKILEIPYQKNRKVTLS